MLFDDDWNFGVFKFKFVLREVILYVFIDSDLLGDFLIFGSCLKEVRLFWFLYFSFFGVKYFEFVFDEFLLGFDGGD